MNEWGIPDWRDPTMYENGEEWSKNRWRWEFLRRRDDLRDEFDKYSDDTYQRKLDFRRWLETENPAGVGGPLTCPKERGFVIFSKILSWELPNPRIGDQPEFAISWRWPESSIKEFTRVTAPDGHFRVDFDLNLPITAQIESARKALIDMQVATTGKKAQIRRHPEKWPVYLRVLDARTSEASWRDISGILTSTAASQQTARDVHRQAHSLCFNF